MKSEWPEWSNHVLAEQKRFDKNQQQLIAQGVELKVLLTQVVDGVKIQKTINAKLQNNDKALDKRVIPLEGFKNKMQGSGLFLALCSTVLGIIYKLFM